MLSIIIPFYNEQENISILIGRIKSLFGHEDRKHHEIICVDDGSTDNTFTELKKTTVNSSNIVLIKLARNSGPDVAQ